jgi:hypothetical protein
VAAGDKERVGVMGAAGAEGVLTMVVAGVTGVDITVAAGDTPAMAPASLARRSEARSLAQPSQTRIAVTSTIPAMTRGEILSDTRRVLAPVIELSWGIEKS